MKIQLNDVLVRDLSDPDHPDKKAFYRVLWVDVPNDVAFLFKLAAPYAPPEQWVYQQIIDSLEAGSIQVTEYRLPPHMLKKEEQIPLKHLKKRDDTWNLIGPLVNRTNEPMIYDPEIRGQQIRELESRASIHRRQIYRYIYRFWAYGKVPNAFLPASENSGGRGKTRPANGKKRGRKPNVVKTGHNVELTGKNITEEDRRNFTKGIHLFAAPKNGGLPPTVARLFKLITTKFYVAGYQQQENGELLPIPLPSNDVPTEGQFRYWYRKEQDALKIKRAQVGEKKWLNSYRGLGGKARHGVHGPGERFEIDSTVADAYLASRYNINWVIGRPVVYMVIDVFSDVVIGLHVALEGPGWAGARMALINAFSDKVTFCRRYGINITPDQWPCHHLPQKLAADRAELLGNATEGLINHLNVHVEIAPAYRPDCKPIVERSFRTLNDLAVKWVPGAVRARQKERGEPDYRLQACLTIEDFTQILIRSILYHNQHSDRPDLLTREMIAADVLPFPNDIWKWGVENLTGCLPSYDIDQVRTFLLPQGKATVAHDGIWFKGMPYTCKRAMDENWLAQARNGKTWHLPVWYDTDWTNEIFFLPEGCKQLETCTLADPNQMYSNMRLEEVIDMMEFLKMDKSERIHRHNTATTQLIAQNAALCDSAREVKIEQQEPLSKRQAIGDIQYHRQVENAANKVLQRSENRSSPVTPSMSDRLAITTPQAGGNAFKNDLIRQLEEANARRFEDE